MTDIKILSICIPTFNRANYLDRLLTSISANAQLDKCSICISDNDSSDNTAEVVRKWQLNSCLHINYSQNKYNIGADRNYFKAVNMASTRFCWLMGSDDLIDPNALSFLIPVLYQFDIAIVQARPLDQQLNNSTVNSYPPALKQDQYSDLSIYTISSHSDAINYFNSCQNLVGVFSYISSIIFNKEKVKFDIDEALDGSLYSHVKPLVSEILNQNCIIGYISRPLAINQRGNDSFLQNWAQRALVDFSGYYRVCQYLELHDDIKESFLSILNREHPPLATFYIFSFTSLWSYQSDIALLQYMSMVPNRIFVIDVLMYMMAFPVRFAYSIYKLFFHS